MNNNSNLPFYYTNYWYTGMTSSSCRLNNGGICSSGQPAMLPDAGPDVGTSPGNADIVGGHPPTPCQTYLGGP